MFKKKFFKFLNKLGFEFLPEKTEATSSPSVIEQILFPLSPQENYEQKYLTSRENAVFITTLLQKHIDLKKQKIFFDWGFQKDRINVHFPELIGSAQSYLGAPHDYEDGIVNLNISHDQEKMDVSMGISTLNHLPEELVQRAYKSLIRGSKSGGVLLLTTQGENFKSQLSESELDKFEKGEVVTRAIKESEPPKYSSFFPKGYLEKLFKNDVVLEHVVIPKENKKYLPHDIWIIKKKRQVLFEVHITVVEINENDISTFVDFCEKIKVKPILIELEEGVVTQQPMISKVFNNIPRNELLAEIENLKEKFIQANYTITRVKVEVPVSCIKEGINAFPDFKGRYFEWHGKVKHHDFKQLKLLVNRINKAHLSKNSLKGDSERRFVTLRNYMSEQSFNVEIYKLKELFKKEKIHIFKEEYEYVVFDSNKNVDDGWIDIPEITDRDYLRLLGFEGFLRRASQRQEKFILKGSILTRQYLKDKSIRSPNDLDFVYAYPISDAEKAVPIFNTWLKESVETKVDDIINFHEFEGEDDAWRIIDYAMNDDFPTISNSLVFSIKGHYSEYLDVDISFNLPVEEEPIEYLYEPERGEPFVLPYTVPLSLQISWKLHQTIVRPRTKDLMDVILLLGNNDLSDDETQKVANHFVKECIKDKIDPRRIFHFLNGDVLRLYPLDENKKDKWAAYDTKFGFSFGSGFSLEYVDEKMRSYMKYENMETLIQNFEEELNKVNLRMHIENEIRI